VTNWWQRRKDRKHCPHSNLRPIYGDEIYQAGGYRLHCRDCRQLVGGPVALAKLRAHERMEE
jgi:hypothetical protein